MRVHARIQGHDIWPTTINTYPSYLWKCYASSATEKMCLCQLTVSHIFGLTFTAAVIHICLQRAVITRMTRSPPPHPTASDNVPHFDLFCRICTFLKSGFYPLYMKWRLFYYSQKKVIWYNAILKRENYKSPKSHMLCRRCFYTNLHFIISLRLSSIGCLLFCLPSLTLYCSWQMTAPPSAGSCQMGVFPSHCR